MTPDLVLWLRSQLDADEQKHSVIMFSGIDDRRFELRTVAAHRAILDDYEDLRRWADDPSNDPATAAAYGSCALALTMVIRRLAEIYTERPGFDPSWKVET